MSCGLWDPMLFASWLKLSGFSLSCAPAMMCCSAQAMEPITSHQLLPELWAKTPLSVTADHVRVGCLDGNLLKCPAEIKAAPPGVLGCYCPRTCQEKAAQNSMSSSCSAPDEISTGSWGSSLAPSFGSL